MIVFLGDSWGVGEWGVNLDKTPCLTGPGIVQMVSLHSNGGVVNLCQGGSSNTQSIDRLELFLSKYSPNQDQFYWIYTEPIRCFDVDNLPKFKIKVNLIEKIHTTLHRANEIAKKHNITIFLIGGCCDLNEIKFDNYEWLKLAIPSWIGCIDSNYPQSIYANDQKWKILGNTLNDAKTKEEWLSIQKDIDSKLVYTSINNNYFSIKNDLHPNRLAHKILKDNLFHEFQHLY
jgi:hypothetical protein